MTQITDTHCHPHFRAYDTDRAAMFERARTAGVSMFAIGTNIKNSATAVQLAESEPDIWASIGMHPSHLGPAPVDLYEDTEHFIEVFNPDDYRKLAQSKKVVAIGESGLDFYRSDQWADANQQKNKQLENFRAHLDLADELGLPVIVHCRDAHAETQEMFRQYLSAGKLSRRGVIHCFTGTRAEAEVYLELGFYISFTGIVTFPSRKGQAESPLEIAAALPLDRIMIETDAPYIAPVPFRGKRNEPAYVVQVAKTLADARGLTIEELAEATNKNTEQLFGI